jgi:hypothetical protein
MAHTRTGEDNIKMDIKLVGRVRTGFNCLGIEKSVGLLYARKRTVGFRKMWKIS